MKRTHILVPLGVLVASALAVGCGHPQPSTSTTTPKKPVHKTHKVHKAPKNKVVHYTSPTTGLPEKKVGGQFFAATVENSPQARPQTGLASADIVYEMEAEGTITRYLAIFHDSIPPMVGPMRSARPYFVTTAQDWGAPFIHYGGSPEAYAMLKTYPYAQIDGIYQGKYFDRDSSRQAPHNAYLLTSRLDPFHTSVQNGHFSFGKPGLAGGSTIHTIDINYNSFTQVKYEYDSKTKTYLRYQDGEPDNDRGSGKQIETSNIIVQYTHMAPIPHDTHGRITINLDGPGLAQYYMQGKRVDGTWKRDQTGKVVYYNVKGQRITLTPGKTWIEVVDDSVPVLTSAR